MPLPSDEGRLTLACGAGLWVGTVQGPVRPLDLGDTVCLVVDLVHEGADGRPREAVASLRLSRAAALALRGALCGRQ